MIGDIEEVVSKREQNEDLIYLSCNVKSYR
jgi:hypothetical protein